MADFPIAKDPLIAPYSESTTSGVLRTEMEGVIKQSLRYSKQYINRNVTYLFSDAELATFRTFFSTTLTRGVDSFNWPDPLDSNTLKDARIVNGEYGVSKMGPNVSQVSFTLEVLE